MTRVKSLIVALVPLLLLTACASEPIISGKAHPPMWEARHGDARMTIIGSVHLLPVELNWQDARVAAAIADADELRLEIPPGTNERIADQFRIAATNEAVAPIARRIGQSSADQLLDRLAGAGLDEDAADRMESWGLMILLSSQQSRDAGLNADNGVEGRLTLAFLRSGKPIEGLETVSEQFNAFDLLPDATQDAILRATVDDPTDARTRLARLLRFWADGDIDQIARTVNDDMADFPQVFDAVVVRRNRAWARRLDALRDSSDHILVAVGTGHLVGPAGLPRLLANAGWQVRPIP